MLGMVIINYNDYGMTKRLIKNVKDYKILDRIVIVDNNSNDNSFEKLKKLESEKIDVIESKQNKGYAAGLNMGAKHLMKKLGKCNIIFSNSDIIINKEEDLKELNDIIDKDIKVVGPTIVENKTLNRGWRLPTVKDEIKGNLSYEKYQKSINYPDSYYQGDISEVDVTSGCFFLMESEALKKAKFFDENTFLYYEENIMACKMKKLGYKEAVHNKVVIVHDHSITIDKSINNYDKYNALKDSQEYFVKEYLKATDNEIKKLRRNRKIYTFLKFRR